MQPRTVRGAVRSNPQSNLAVISVAGHYAAAEAWEALKNGLHVLLFSDNVSIEDEIALKDYAAQHGLLMMGPGCGTAIINGVALGFALQMNLTLGVMLVAFVIASLLIRLSRQKLVGREFWQSPKGIALLAGGGGAVLLAVAGGSESNVSPFLP